MSNRTFAIVACVTLVCGADPASAQIFTSVDANGRLLLSNKAIDAPTVVYLVEGAPAIRTTRAVESLEATERYEPFVLEHAARHSLRPELVRAVIQVESGFNPRARSPKGAMGLMQLMPATAKELGVTNPFDPEDNIRAGTRYLRQLMDRYAGDELLALAAYNAGSGAVDRHGRSVPPYRETREYVRKVSAAADDAHAPASGVHAPAAMRAKLVMYKTIEILGDRAVPRYSSEKPLSGTFEVVQR